MIYPPGHSYLHKHHPPKIYGSALWTCGAPTEEIKGDGKWTQLQSLQLARPGQKKRFRDQKTRRCRQPAATACHQQPPLQSLFLHSLGFLGEETWCWVRWLGQGPQLGTIGAKGRRVVFHRSGQPPLIWGGPAPWRPPRWYPGQWLWSEGLKYTSPTSANPHHPSQSVQLWTGWANVGRCAWAGCNYAGSLTPQPLLDNTPTVTEHDKKHNNLASYMYPPKYGISFVGTAIPKTHAQ